MPILTFNAHGSAETPTKLIVKARGFTLTIDEPPSLGGEDAGPNPVEYILAGFMGCMNVVVHMVAKERGVKINSLEVEASGPLDPTRLEGRPTEERAGYQSIELVFTIDADASEEEIAEVVRIAETRCPVSDNLTNSTPITVRVRSST